MTRWLTPLALAATAALCLVPAQPMPSPLFGAVTALAAPEPPADRPADPQPAAWQEQWQLLLRREEQLRRDQQQVQAITPRLQPAIVGELERGLEQTRQRLARQRQQLIQAQPAQAETETTSSLHP
jgi:hypothetical protein